MAPKDHIDCTEKNPTAQTVHLFGRPISISAISRKTGYSVGRISLILSGKRNPPVNVAKVIADALLVSTDELMQGIAERNTKTNV